jgi:hypothetical protein
MVEAGPGSYGWCEEEGTAPEIFRRKTDRMGQEKWLRKEE